MMDSASETKIRLSDVIAELLSELSRAMQEGEGQDDRVKRRLLSRVPQEDMEEPQFQAPGSRMPDGRKLVNFVL